MSTNRRTFLRNIGLGAGVVASTPLMASAGVSEKEQVKFIRKSAEHVPAMNFNMCGYAAPKLDKVRIGFVGIGDRGIGAVDRMGFIDGVEVTALCDTRQAAIDGAQASLKKSGFPKAKEFTGSDTAFKELCDSGLVDLVYIATPWEWHVPVALAAMRGGNHAAVEVSTAKTMDECWEMVEVSEQTKKHCVILENCCYDFFELLTLNMARQGVFGDLVHGEGAYIHDLEVYPEQVEFFLYNEVLPGYAWIFPTAENEANIGLGMRLDIFRKAHGDLNVLLQKFIDLPELKKRLKRGGELDKIRSWQLNFGSQKSLQHTFDGALLVGDAAGFINPVTGGGIHNALISAELAATTIAEAIAADDVSRSRLKIYEKRTHEVMWPSMRRSYLFQRMLINFPSLIDLLVVRARENHSIVRTFLDKL